MTRRFEKDSASGLWRRRASPSVFVSTGATAVYLAEHASDNGSITTALNNYIGTATPLLAQGTGQGVKRASAYFGGRPAIPFAGGSAANGYGAVVLGGAPSEFTSVTVALVSGDNSGLCALTNAGAVNSGNATMVASAVNRARKVSADAQRAGAVPSVVVLVGVFDAAGAALYATRRTADTVVSAGALAGTTFHVGTLSTSGTFTLTGEWAMSAYWTRALSAAEVALVLDELGDQYDIAIGA